MTEYHSVTELAKNSVGQQCFRIINLSPFRAMLLGVFLASGAMAADGGGALPTPTVDRRASVERQTVVAYSFHGTLRCSTCLLVEQGAEKAIRETFPDELNDGSLAWRSVNIRLPENRHFAADFQVESSALVLVVYRGESAGRWKNLPLAGELVRADAGVFRRYVTAEVRSFLDNPKAITGDHE